MWPTPQHWARCPHQVELNLYSAGQHYPLWKGNVSTLNYQISLILSTLSQFLSQTDFSSCVVYLGRRWKHMACLVICKSTVQTSNLLTILWKSSSSSTNKPSRYLFQDQLDWLLFFPFLFILILILFIDSYFFFFYLFWFWFYLFIFQVSIPGSARLTHIIVFIDEITDLLSNAIKQDGDHNYPPALRNACRVALKLTNKYYTLTDCSPLFRIAMGMFHFYSLKIIICSDWWLFYFGQCFTHPLKMNTLRLLAGKKNGLLKPFALHGKCSTRTTSPNWTIHPPLNHPKWPRWCY